MEIESIRHKALRRFVETNEPKGLPADLVDRLRKMIVFILDADDFEALAEPPNYGLHALKGDRSGDWAMTVSRTWRMAFRKIDERTIGDLDLEDYH